MGQIQTKRETIDGMMREVSQGNAVFKYRSGELEALVNLTLRPKAMAIKFDKLSDTFDPVILQESGIENYDRLCAELSSTYMELSQAGPEALAMLINYTDTVSNGGDVPDATAQLQESRERVADLKQKATALLQAVNVCRAETLSELSGLIANRTAERRGDFKAAYDREVEEFRDMIADKLLDLATAKSNYDRSMADVLNPATLLQAIPVPLAPESIADAEPVLVK